MRNKPKKRECKTNILQQFAGFHYVLFCAAVFPRTYYLFNEICSAKHKTRTVCERETFTRGSLIETVFCFTHFLNELLPHLETHTSPSHHFECEVKIKKCFKKVHFITSSVCL